MSPSSAPRFAASLAAVLLASAASPAQAAEPSAWCDALFPVDDIAAVIGGERAAGIARRASGVVPEDARRCSRIYSIGDDRFDGGGDVDGKKDVGYRLWDRRRVGP